MIEDLTAEQALGFATESGSSHNYTDFLRNHSDLRQYEFWGYREGRDLLAVAGLSPDGSLSLYSDSAAVGDLLLKSVLIRRPRPTAVFGDACLAAAVEHGIDARVQRFESILYMRKEWDSIAAGCTTQTLKRNAFDVSVRLAQAADQDLVDRWYGIYNRQESTSWKVPTINAFKRERLLLAFVGDTFVGGGANTLLSNNRLWIGRLYTYPEYRRKGVASAIMDMVEQIASSERKSVDLLVFATNAAATQFYSRRGYTVSATRGFWGFESH